MRLTFLLVVLTASTSISTAAEIETVTTENGVPSRWGMTSVAADGKVRFDEGGFGATATMSGAAGSANANVEYTRTASQDTMIFDPDSGEIMSVEGEICRVLSKDSVPPPGMGFMNSQEMKDHQQQMAGAMAGADKQIAEAMAQMKNSGASQAQIDAMNQMLGGLTTATQPPNRDALQIELLEKNTAVGNFNTDVYLARTADGVEKYRFYMADSSDLPGGQAVRNGMASMVESFADVMNQMGIDGIMDEGIVTMITSEDFNDQYPVAIEDLERGTRTEVTKASGAPSDADFSPDCEKRDMMSF